MMALNSHQNHVVTLHLNGLVETVQMRGHNICFYAALTKIIPNYHQILPLIALRTLLFPDLYVHLFVWQTFQSCGSYMFD